jgi:hypothetical protein
MLYQTDGRSEKIKEGDGAANATPSHCTTTRKIVASFLVSILSTSEQMLQQQRAAIISLPKV